MTERRHITIEGDLPWDLGRSFFETAVSIEERDAVERLQVCLAQMAGPSFGLRIGWSKTTVRREATRFGGMKAHYGFRIDGTEAVEDSWLEPLVAAIVLVGGRVTFVRIICDGGETLNLGTAGVAGRRADVRLRLWLAGIIVKSYPKLEEVVV